jgi:hypothetical protein
MNDYSERKPMLVNGRGVLGTFVALSATFTERTTQNVFGALRDSQVELGGSVDATFGWLDGMQHSGNKIVRNLARRVFEVSFAAIDFGEHTLTSWIGALGTTGHDATDLAARTATTIAIGPEVRAVS